MAVLVPKKVKSSKKKWVSNELAYTPITESNNTNKMQNCWQAGAFNISAPCPSNRPNSEWGIWRSEDYLPQHKTAWKLLSTCQQPPCLPSPWLQTAGRKQFDFKRLSLTFILITGCVKPAPTFLIPQTQNLHLLLCLQDEKLQLYEIAGRPHKPAHPHPHQDSTATKIDRAYWK